MKYEIKKSQYLIDIDFNKKILIIDDIFNIQLKNRILLNINNWFNNELELKEKIEELLNYNFDEDVLIKILKLSIEDHLNNDIVFKLGKLKIEDYWIYTTIHILNELSINKKDYCFIGGQILRFYWLNRQTSDTDILLLANNKLMLEIIKTLKTKNIDIEHFYIDEDTNEPIWSLIRFVYNWVEIDILATKYNFQDNAIYNANTIKISNDDFINIISLNDLIIFKIYANSYKDLADAEALIKLNIDKIHKKDIIYIKTQLKQIWKENIFDNLMKYE